MDILCGEPSGAGGKAIWSNFKKLKFCASTATYACTLAARDSSGNLRACSICADSNVYGQRVYACQCLWTGGVAAAQGDVRSCQASVCACHNVCAKSGDVRAGSGHVYGTDVCASRSVISSGGVCGNGVYANYVIVDPTGSGLVCAKCGWFCKLTYCAGDPSLVLYNAESRKDIVELAKESVPPDIAGGAILFYNKDTRAFEVYKMAEGKFCSMFGELLETLPAPVIADADDVEEVYRFSARTGTVTKHQRLRPKTKRLKRGHVLDAATGKIVREDNGAEVDLADAVEVTRPPLTPSSAEKIAKRLEQQRQREAARTAKRDKQR